MPYTINQPPITRSLIGAAVIVGAVAFVAGCGTNTESPTTKPSTSQNVQRDAQYGAGSNQDLRDYSFEQKDVFVTRMETQLDDLERELDQWEETIDDSNDARQAEARPKLKALRAEQERLNEQLDEVRDSEASSWSRIKTSMSNGYTATRDGVRSARQWTSDAIAP